MPEAPRDPGTCTGQNTGPGLQVQSLTELWPTATNTCSVAVEKFKQDFAEGDFFLFARHHVGNIFHGDAH